MGIVKGLIFGGLTWLALRFIDPLTMLVCTGSASSTMFNDIGQGVDCMITVSVIVGVAAVIGFLMED